MLRSLVNTHITGLSSRSGTGGVKSVTRYACTHVRMYACMHVRMYACKHVAPVEGVLLCVVPKE